MAALSLILLGLGSGLVWAGVTGSSLPDELRKLFSGEPAFTKASQ